MKALKSPARISRGIRSSYELTQPPFEWREVSFGNRHPSKMLRNLATVREIPPPTYCVVSKRGVLRAVFERIEPQ